MPVIHKGYISILEKYPDDVWVLGEDIISDYTSLTRDLRIVNPKDLIKAIKGLKKVKKVSILTKKNIVSFAKKAKKIVMPKEDISFDLQKKFFTKNQVDFENIFLRYDKLITTTETVIPTHRKRTSNIEDKEIIKKAFEDSNKSADWWRQIGAVVKKGDKILYISHNRHLPTDYHLSYYGDPRSNFNAGERLDIYTSIHGEADIISKAAKDGVSLKNSNIYTTTFPCPNCARLIGEAGIKKVYYSKGYSRLDAEEILKTYNVEIILVEE